MKCFTGKKVEVEDHLRLANIIQQLRVLYWFYSGSKVQHGQFMLLKAIFARS